MESSEAMNAPFVVAQAGSGSPTGIRPVRTVKVTKPQGDQAVTVELGYDQNYKLDLSAISNEKITLIHIGEKLIILFDNKSTVTVAPFFDSMNVPLSNVIVETAGRDFSSGDFALAFPITTDQSVLTAAGATGAVGTPPSGADFHGSSVDPLNVPNPLPLLPPEALGTWVSTQQQGVPTTTITVLPTGQGAASLTVFESGLDTSKDGIDLVAGTVSGSNPGPDSESDQNTGGLAFTAGSTPIAITFADPASDPHWVEPIITGLAPGYSITDRKSTRLNSSHIQKSRMPSSA